MFDEVTCLMKNQKARNNKKEKEKRRGKKEKIISFYTFVYTKKEKSLIKKKPTKLTQVKKARKRKVEK